ncbi:XF1762 family protein [Streptomyces sp. NPDC127098]|uniref:XF1762 family protein n=1 Tax=Streptomyces sp. NPDC127098 TaxID=3347137 RepID=UPI00365D6B77
MKERDPVRGAAHSALEIVPVTFRQAKQFIATHHRHHPPPQGMKVALGVAADDILVGVAVVGRPLARHLDDGRTAEVTRTCTNGTPNANSKLYGAAWRAAKALGFRRLITYTRHPTCRTCEHPPDAHSSPSDTAHTAQPGPGRCAHPQCVCQRYEGGETGASLRAAGFQAVAHLPAHHGWDRPSRPRSARYAATDRIRWEITRTRGAPAGHPPANEGPP